MVVALPVICFEMCNFIVCKINRTYANLEALYLLGKTVTQVKRKKYDLVLTKDRSLEILLRAVSMTC